MKADIPANPIDRAQNRVEQLLEALRRETGRLGPLDDSALEYSPAQAPEAPEGRQARDE